MLNMVVHIVTTGLYRVDTHNIFRVLSILFSKSSCHSIDTHTFSSLVWQSLNQYLWLTHKFILQRISGTIITAANNTSDIKTTTNTCMANSFQSKMLNQITQLSPMTTNERLTYYVKHQIHVNVPHQAMSASTLGLAIIFSILCFILNSYKHMHNAIHHHLTQGFQRHGLQATCSL